MVSCPSDNWCTLMTFQWQESSVQATKIALWTKSRQMQRGFYLDSAELFGWDPPHRLNLYIASSTLGESQEAVLTARHLQLCPKPCIPIVPIVTSSIEQSIAVLLDHGVSVINVTVSSLLCLYAFCESTAHVHTCGFLLSQVKAS